MGIAHIWCTDIYAGKTPIHIKVKSEGGGEEEDEERRERQSEAGRQVGFSDRRTESR